MTPQRSQCSADSPTAIRLNARSRHGFKGLCRLQVPSEPPGLSGDLRGRGQFAELLHEAHQICVGPMLYEFAVHDAVDGDAHDLLSLPFGGMPRISPVKGSTASQARYHLVVFGDLILDDVDRVREGCSQRLVGLTYAGGAWWHPR